MVLSNVQYKKKSKNADFSSGSVGVLLKAAVLNKDPPQQFGLQFFLMAIMWFQTPLQTTTKRKNKSPKARKSKHVRDHKSVLWIYTWRHNFEALIAFLCLASFFNTKHSSNSFINIHKTLNVFWIETFASNLMQSNVWRHGELRRKHPG